MMIEPKVVIILLNWNRAEDTRECLESVLALDYQSYEVIVIDNGSTEPASRLLGSDFPVITVIESEENRGFCESNNAGMTRALEMGAEYVFLLNNDTVVDRLCLRRLVDVGQKDVSIGALGPTIYDYQQPEEVSSAGGEINWWLGRPYDLHNVEHTCHTEVAYLSGCALLVRRSVVERVGRLDQSFFLYYEDADWCLRMRKEGFKVVHVPGAKVWHKRSQTTKGPRSSLSLYYGTRNRLLFLKRHAHPLVWCFFLVVVFPFSIVKNLWLLRRNKEKRASFLEGATDFVRGRVGRRRGCV